MIIVKILGIIDICAALFFWLFSFFGIFSGTAAVFAFILLIKGVFFMLSADLASIVDVVLSLIIFLSLYLPLPKFIVVVITLYLLGKGIMSLL